MIVGIMRLANCYLSFHWALGLCLLLFWATTSTQARVIAKRETPNGDMGVAVVVASATDPDIVKLNSESVNGSDTTTTTIYNDNLKRAEQEELTSTTSTTTETAKLAMNSTVISTVPANVDAIKLVDAIQSHAEEKQEHEHTTTAQLKLETVEPLKFSEDSKLVITNLTITADAQEQQQQMELELTTASTTTTSSTTEAIKDTTTTTTAAATTTKASLASTQRSEDHARSMQFASSTESFTFVSPVTPMKLRPLPMTTTTTTHTTTTHTPQLLAALLHAGVTVTPRESHENAIEEEQLHPQPEKRAKFISDNSTNAQQLTLPNAAEVWSLAAMKMVPSTTTTTTTTLPQTVKGTELNNDIETHQDKNQTMQHKEKNLLDWQQIMMMQTSQENRTEAMMSTTLDATEAATQATTLKLDAMETSASNAVTDSTVNKSEESNMLNMVSAAVKLQDDEQAPTPTTEASTDALTDLTKAKPELTETEEKVESIETVNATAKSELTELSKLSLQAVEGAVTVVNSVTTTEAATIATTTTTTPASLTTAEPVIPAITTTATTTTTGMPSALNATPNPNSNTNEMAMKATAHENNENGDKANDVDSGSERADVINVSVSVSTTETTLAATESQPITVSTRTAGEVSTTPTTTTTTSTPTSTPKILHAKVDEQLAASTTTLATPTPTEINQISNEVNLETITVKNVTKDNNNNNEFTSVNNNLLITTTTSSTEKPNYSAANSESTLEINNNSTANILTTTTITSLLTDEKANSKLNEHETSLETNNISETAGTAPIRTTTIAVEIVPTTETTAALKESKLTTTTAAAATTTTITSTAAKGESEFYEDEDEQQQIDHDRDADTEEALLAKTNMANTTTTTTTTTSTTTTGAPRTTTTEEPLISLLDDSTTTTTSSTTTTTATTTTTTTTTPRPTTTTTTTAEPIYSSTTTTDNNNNNNHIIINSNNMLPIESNTEASGATLGLPTTMLMPPHPTDHMDHMQQPHGNTGTDVNVIIAITVSVIGVVALILLVAFLYLMRKRQKQMSYGQRCRPVSLDAYSLDNVSVLGSVRRKGRDLRASKRTYGNAAFDDPSLRHNLVSATELGKFLERRSSIFEEFRDVPQIIARADEVPAGCEDKNRYANVIPLPETRVVLQRQGDDDKTEYINANYVRGPRDAPNYYIACQAPLESTTGDFWRMIWEQQSRVIVQATDLNENGIERCAEYLPPSVTLDNHSSYGDYQVTLKHREVKDKYAISTLMLKRVDGDECRELTHYWYKWPEAGVPLEEAPIIAMLLEARSSLKSYALEQANELKEKSSTLPLKSLETALDNTEETKKPEEAGSTSSGASNEINGNVANKQQTRSQQGHGTYWHHHRL
ncbi:mucin-5AC isoform X2 [Drosophila innubila]|uniref:mucin-5AC isoform X2 n=1 Tax=Drosophila innubila TaxID=198719 RepID=UPI00148D1A40|nr:mucin-5AC isoform X2 [Drosophila innubila]